jgi:Mn-dependent DtxR family transcriptional regulator
MGLLDEMKNYVVEKKTEHRLSKITKRLRDDPNNKPIISKLDQLYDKREQLLKELHNTEGQIDIALHMLYYNDNKL